MLKTFFLSLCLAFSLADTDVQELFSDWAKEHGKVYENKKDMTRRLGIFKTNLAWINQRNTELKNMTVGLNHFADMSQEEFAAVYLQPLNTTDYMLSIEEFTVPQDPDNISVGQSCHTPIRNQGQCGSCYAFSATGAAEGLFCLPGKDNNTHGWFSPQQVVDCEGGGCSGGWAPSTLHYLQSIKMCTDESYPYKSGRTGHSQSCEDKSCATTWTGINSIITCNDGEELAAALNAGNFVSIAVDGNGMDFQFYQSGMFMPSVNCDHHQINHAVLAVEFVGNHPVRCSDSYYKVKNSWGANWGMQGYFHIPAGCNCLGVGQYPSAYPSYFTKA